MSGFATASLSGHATAEYKHVVGLVALIRTDQYANMLVSIRARILRIPALAVLLRSLHLLGCGNPFMKRHERNALARKGTRTLARKGMRRPCVDSRAHHSTPHLKAVMLPLSMIRACMQTHIVILHVHSARKLSSLIIAVQCCLAKLGHAR